VFSNHRRAACFRASHLRSFRLGARQARLFPTLFFAESPRPAFTTRAHWCFHALAIFVIGESLNSGGISDSGAMPCARSVAAVLLSVTVAKGDRTASAVFSTAAFADDCRRVRTHEKSAVIVRKRRDDSANFVTADRDQPSTLAARQIDAERTRDIVERFRAAPRLNQLRNARPAPRLVGRGETRRSRNCTARSGFAEDLGHLIEATTSGLEGNGLGRHPHLPCTDRLCNQRHLDAAGARNTGRRAEDFSTPLFLHFLPKSALIGAQRETSKSRFLL
jgi:hypothetical protein